MAVTETAVCGEGLLAAPGCVQLVVSGHDFLAAAAKDLKPLHLFSGDSAGLA